MSQIKNLQRTRASVVQALIHCQHMNSTVVNETKSYLYKALKNLDKLVEKKDAIKLEKQERIFSENKSNGHVKKAHSTVTSNKTLEALNRLIDDKEKQLNELLSKKNKKVDQNNDQNDQVIID